MIKILCINVSMRLKGYRGHYSQRIDFTTWFAIEQRQSEIWVSTQTKTVNIVAVNTDLTRLAWRQRILAWWTLVLLPTPWLKFGLISPQTRESNYNQVCKNMKRTSKLEETNWNGLAIKPTRQGCFSGLNTNDLLVHLVPLPLHQAFQGPADTNDLLVHLVPWRFHKAFRGPTDTNGLLVHLVPWRLHQAFRGPRDQHGGWWNRKETNHSCGILGWEER